MDWIWVALGALLLGIAFLLLAFWLGMREKSPTVFRTVRAFNRRFMNPRQLKTAGAPGAYAGIVRHVGRRSGTVYDTPVVPYPTDGGFVVTLPYGVTSQWVKNVLAAGSATVVYEGETYGVDRPELVPIAEVVEVLPAKEWRTARLYRVELALRLRCVEAGGVERPPGP